MLAATTSGELPLPDVLVNLAGFLIIGTWFLLFMVVFFWVAIHIDKLTPDYLFRRRQPQTEGQPASAGCGGNTIAIISLAVAILSLISTTLIGLAQLNLMGH